MSKLKTRLDRLFRLLGSEGPGYTMPETIDVRRMDAAQRAAAIAEAEPRAENQRFKGVHLVIVDRCEPQQKYVEVYDAR